MSKSTTEQSVTPVINGFLLSSLGEGSLAAMGLAAALGGIVLGVTGLTEIF